jgi:hypothetical protein
MDVRAARRDPQRFERLKGEAAVAQDLQRVREVVSSLADRRLLRQHQRLRRGSHDELAHHPSACRSFPSWNAVTPLAGSSRSTDRKSDI